MLQFALTGMLWKKNKTSICAAFSTVRNILVKEKHVVGRERGLFIETGHMLFYKVSNENRFEIK